MARRSSVVLPAPFGPISTVGGPVASVSERWSRMVASRAMMRHVFEHDRQVGGRRAHGVIPQAARRRAARPRRAALTAITIAISTRPSPMRERQVALRGLQRDRGGHGAGEAVDIAADDDDGADLGGGAAEAGEQRGGEAEAARPRSGWRRARAGRHSWRRARRDIRPTNPRWSGASARR